MHKIFVYGTLKRGHGNHRLLANARFIGTGISEPVFTMLHLGGFPGIVRSGETAIHGELYEVDEGTLHRLDRLEGHPSFYERQPMKVVLEGTEVAAEGYVLPLGYLSRGAKQLPDGVWGER